MGYQNADRFCQQKQLLNTDKKKTCFNCEVEKVTPSFSLRIANNSMKHNLRDSTRYIYVKLM